jgi:hypothetical protein
MHGILMQAWNYHNEQTAHQYRYVWYYSKETNEHELFWYKKQTCEYA